MRDGTPPAKRDDATIPEDRRTGYPPSVLSCTAWGFSCLADCSASGELLPRLFNLTCASLPKNRRCLFCDTFRQPRLASGLPACFTRHAAVWCSDFPLRIASERSSAIAESLPHQSPGGKPEESGKQEKRNGPCVWASKSKENFLLSYFPDSVLPANLLTIHRAFL